jgi:CrcB protein
MPEWLTSSLLIAAGGAAGANARFWLGRLVATVQEAQLGGVEFPWATFLINVSGSVVLGFVAAAYFRHPDPIHKHWYLLLATGFCGGYTTFSTFSYETFQLIEGGKVWTAAAYSLGSVECGVVGVWVAVWLSKK